jgi:hypothetical protein
MQKQHRELELIIQECILNAVRESIPIESILRAYMDETVEEEVIEEIKEQKITEAIKPKQHISEHISESKSVAVAAAIDTTPPSQLETQFKSSLKFDDVDRRIDTNNREDTINAPKNFERLEEISNLRNIQRRLENEEDDDDSDKIRISDQNVSLNDFDVHNIDEPIQNMIPDLLFDDIEILE